MLDDVTLRINKNEFVTILGPSGCGKSTLVDIIVGEKGVDSGYIDLNLKKKKGLGGIDVVWQEDAVMPWKTVFENIKFPLEIADFDDESCEERVASLIEDMGLTGFGDYYPSKISIGMRKRVALASALATRPDLLVMDEPFSSVDAFTKLKIEQKVLDIWNELGSTAILVTHDVREAVSLSDRIVILTDKPSSVKEIFNNPLERPRNLKFLYNDDKFHRIVRKVWSKLTEI